MASENETVADIVKEKRDTADEAELKGKNTFAFDLAKMLREEANRIEAAHQREVAELKRKVAELRECLKETMVIAIAEYHYHSCFKHVKCGEIERCKTCKVARWRKALKGASND